METRREGDSTHLATNEPNGLPPLPSEQGGQRFSRVCSSLQVPPDAVLFCYQETAEAEDQLEEEKAAGAGLYRRYRCLGNAIERLWALAMATSFVLAGCNAGVLATIGDLHTGIGLQVMKKGSVDSGANSTPSPSAQLLSA
ncbi:MAG: hypothetical protein AB2556_07445 [Candidatus Thiodiazotropha sp.]